MNSNPNQKQPTTSVADFPEGVLVIMLSYMNAREMTYCKITCTAMRQAARSPVLLRMIDDSRLKAGWGEAGWAGFGFNWQIQQDFTDMVDRKWTEKDTRLGRKWSDFWNHIREEHPESFIKALVVSECMPRPCDIQAQFPSSRSKSFGRRIRDLHGVNQGLTSAQWGCLMSCVWKISHEYNNCWHYEWSAYHFQYSSVNLNDL